eukprot:NODE_943_length_2861_cov_0.133961.p1 type:complete len:279 gc:universal NODE_943_length_2861_cov_0.133961:1303-2139(+)
MKRVGDLIPSNEKQHLLMNQNRESIRYSMLIILKCIMSYMINIEYFTHAMGLAYCDEVSLRLNKCMHCTGDLEFVERIQKGTITAVVMKNATNLFVVFEGSREAMDWIIDTRVLLVGCPKISDVNTNAKVHQGFYNSYLSVRSKIWGIINRLNLEVIALGHSMGGSLASILALDVSNNSSVKLVTAESPRTGNQAFVDLLESRVDYVYRITNENDLVPFLPALALGYRHTKNEIWITSNSITFCVEAEDKNCIRSIWPNTDMSKHAVIRNISIGSCSE